MLPSLTKIFLRIIDRIPNISLPLNEQNPMHLIEKQDYLKTLSKDSWKDVYINWVNAVNGNVIEPRWLYDVDEWKGYSTCVVSLTRDKVRYFPFGSR